MIEIYKFVTTGQSVTSTVAQYMTKQQPRPTTLNVILHRIKNNCDYQWRAQRVSERGSKFRHNCVASQISFVGSAEGTIILG